MEGPFTIDQGYDSINDLFCTCSGTKDTFSNFDWPTHVLQVKNYSLSPDSLFSSDYSTTYNNHTTEGCLSVSSVHSSSSTASFPGDDVFPATNMLSYNDSGLSYPYQVSSVGCQNFRLYLQGHAAVSSI